MRIFLLGCMIGCVGCAARASQPIRVAGDGTEKFTTLQAAIDSLPDGGSSPRVILIKPGIYKEVVHIGLAKPPIMLKNETRDAEKVVITYDMNSSFTRPGTTQPVGTSGSASVTIESSNFAAENITFENSAGDHGQAVAMKTLGDRMVFRNCRFLGWQDTLMADMGRQYFDRCYVEGRVDFIFGGATAVFDHCTIHSKNGGYITAARTPATQPYGYVFLDCKLTGDPVPTFLGRPWQWDRSGRAAVAFIRTRMGSHIVPEGWNRWDRPNNPNLHPEQVTRYREFGSMDLDGKPLDLTGRVKWSQQLSADEAAKYTVENILGGDDRWNPTSAANP